MNNQSASMPQTAHAANFVTHDNYTYWSTISEWGWASAKEEVMDQRQSFGAMVEWRDANGNGLGVYHFYAVFGCRDNTYEMRFANPYDGQAWWMVWDTFVDGGTMSNGNLGYLYGEVYRPF